MGILAKYTASVELAPGIILTFANETLEGFEDDIKTGCYFAEQCKFNQVEMMRHEDGFLNVKHVCDDLNKALGTNIFQVLHTDTFRKIYDLKEHKFTAEAKLLPLPEDKPTPTAKAAKADEGTIHLDKDMSVDELAEAIKKGGIKTINLDDIDEIKELLRKAKEEAGLDR